MNAIYSDKHYQALIAVSQSLASATHHDAIRTLSRIANHLVRNADVAGGDGGMSQGLSPLARRILTRCAGQTLNSLAIAQVCRKAHGSKSIKTAIRQLLACGFAEKIGSAGATLYAISGQVSGQTSGQTKKAEKII